jgi:hypothetical protein
MPSQIQLRLSCHSSTSVLGSFSPSPKSPQMPFAEQPANRQSRQYIQAACDQPHIPIYQPVCDSAYEGTPKNSRSWDYYIRNSNRCIIRMHEVSTITWTRTRPNYSTSSYALDSSSSPTHFFHCTELLASAIVPYILPPFFANLQSFRYYSPALDLN